MDDIINPKVSIIMSVYNEEQFLKESIDSILNQTFKNFEFIIINDGSTDRTSKILNSYKNRRLKVINQENAGLTRSLNKGIRLARGEYIARMDADDVSEPSRLTFTSSTVCAKLSKVFMAYPPPFFTYFSSYLGG